MRRASEVSRPSSHSRNHVLPLAIEPLRLSSRATNCVKIARHAPLRCRRPRVGHLITELDDLYPRPGTDNRFGRQQIVGDLAVAKADQGLSQMLPT